MLSILARIFRICIGEQYLILTTRHKVSNAGEKRCGEG